MNITLSTFIHPLINSFFLILTLILYHSSHGLHALNIHIRSFSTNMSSVFREQPSASSEEHIDFTKEKDIVEKVQPLDAKQHLLKFLKAVDSTVLQEAIHATKKLLDKKKTDGKAKILKKQLSKSVKNRYKKIVEQGTALQAVKRLYKTFKLAQKLAINKKVLPWDKYMQTEEFKSSWKLSVVMVGDLIRCSNLHKEMMSHYQTHPKPADWRILTTQYSG